jgi:hypothetical protein
MLCRRKDTSNSKVDDIKEEVKDRGRLVFGEEKKYHLVAAGHSLRGALATVFIHDASSDEELDAELHRCIHFLCPKGGRN